MKVYSIKIKMMKIRPKTKVYSVRLKIRPKRKVYSIKIKIRPKNNVYSIRIKIRAKSTVYSSIRMKLGRELQCVVLG